MKQLKSFYGIAIIIVFLISSAWGFTAFIDTRIQNEVNTNNIVIEKVLNEKFGNIDRQLSEIKESIRIQNEDIKEILKRK